jgi:ParB family chromosome partitioning protein
VPIIVRGATPQEMLELALVENIQRADLNPLEEAQAFRQLMDDFGLTQEQVADKVGKDRTTVANALRLLKLPEELKRAVLDEKISEGHARALLMLPDEKLQVSLLATLIAKGLSVRETEELVRRALTKPKPTRASASRAEHAMPAATRALEEEFRKALGTKVQVFRSRRGGKIVVHFYSEEELEAVYQKIVKR